LFICAKHLFSEANRNPQQKGAGTGSTLAGAAAHSAMDALAKSTLAGSSSISASAMRPLK
jgi:hypothetical protein